MAVIITTSSFGVYKTEEYLVGVEHAKLFETYRIELVRPSLRVDRASDVHAFDAQLSLDELRQLRDTLNAVLAEVE